MFSNKNLSLNTCVAGEVLRGRCGQVRVHVLATLGMLVGGQKWPLDVADEKEERKERTEFLYLVVQHM